MADIIKILNISTQILIYFNVLSDERIDFNIVNLYYMLNKILFDEFN